MIGDGPIRISTDEWIVVRNNPRFPKAVIRRIDPGGAAEHYRVVTFDLDRANRRLVGRYRTLEAANDAVPYDRPERTTPDLPPRPATAAQPSARESPFAAASGPVPRQLLSRSARMSG